MPAILTGREARSPTCRARRARVDVRELGLLGGDAHCTRATRADRGREQRHHPGHARHGRPGARRHRQPHEGAGVHWRAGDALRRTHRGALLRSRDREWRHGRRGLLGCLIGRLRPGGRGGAEPAVRIPATFDGDVGLLVLGAAAPATPIAIGPAPKVGDTVEIVGWGLTGEDAGDLGTKREGTTTVTAVSSTSFDVAAHPSQPCAGDSGGPALVTSQGTVFVVGIVSHGDAACSAGATYARPDAFEASFITPTLARYAPGTAATGDRCLFQAQCAGGAASCVAATDDPSLTYCTKACSGSGDCPATMTCASAGGGMQCLYPVPTPGAYGAPCQSDSDCVEGECSSADSPTPSAGVCALRCEPQSASCPSGYACQQTGAIDFFCIATPSSASGGGGGSGGGCGLAPGTESRFGLLGACLLLVVGAVRRATYRRAASPRHAPITPAPRTSARSGVRLRARTHARSPGCEQ